jgi:hypothetical protein
MRVTEQIDAMEVSAVNTNILLRHACSHDSRT